MLYVCPDHRLVEDRIQWVLRVEKRRIAIHYAQSSSEANPSWARGREEEDRQSAGPSRAAALDLYGRDERNEERTKKISFNLSLLSFTSAVPVKQLEKKRKGRRVGWLGSMAWFLNEKERR